MSLQELLTNLTNDLEVGSLNTLAGSIEEISKITPKEYEANERVLQEEFPNFIEALKQSVMKNKEAMVENIDIISPLKEVEKKMPRRIREKYGKEIEQVIKMAGLNIMREQYQNIKERQVEEMENEIINAAVNEDTVGDLKIAPKEMFMSQNLTPIERSILPYEAILNPSTLPEMTSIQRVPESITYLAKYAQIQNKIPYGSVTDKEGLCYVGIEQISEGNEKILVPFSKNKISESKLPDIENQFKYHANRTINSWNKFIEREADLISFTKKISTAKSRLEYVEKQFKTLTIETFSCELLATLMYYYLYLPLEKFSKELFLYPGNEKQSFFEKYPSGTTPKENPLLLKKEEGANVAKILLYEVPLKPLGANKVLAETATESSGLSAQTVLLNVIQYLDKTLENRKVSEKEYKLFKEYMNKRQLEAISFFVASGIEKLKYTNLMAVQLISGVKRRRFVIKSSFVNNQYSNIIEKITKKKEEESKTLWDMYWGCQEIYCHDYVWGYK